MSHHSVTGVKVPSSKDTPAGILDRPFGHVHSSRLLVGITNAGLDISNESKQNKNNLECHSACSAEDGPLSIVHSSFAVRVSNVYR